MTTYNFTSLNGSDGKGGIYSTLTYDDGVGSSSNPVTLVSGDILSIYGGGPVHSAYPAAGEFGGFNPDRLTWSTEDSTADTVQTMTVQNIATNNQVGRVAVGGYSINYIYFKIVGDSTANVPTVTNLTNQAVNTLVQQSFTVSGLGTGLACGVLVDGAELKVNSGSWEGANTPVKVVNGDTVYVRHTTSDQYKSRYPVGLAITDLAGITATTDFYSETIPSPSADYGIQTFDSSDNIILNMSSRLGRLWQAGSFTESVTASESGGSVEFSKVVSVPGMDATDAWVIITDLVDGATYYGYITSVLRETDQVTFGGFVDFNTGYTSATVTVNYKIVLGG